MRRVNYKPAIHAISVPVNLLIKRECLLMYGLAAIVGEVSATGYGFSLDFIESSLPASGFPDGMWEL
jgi:hypothetical protein